MQHNTKDDIIFAASDLKKYSIFSTAGDLVVTRVGESVESALSALAAIFLALSRILTIFDKNTVF